MSGKDILEFDDRSYEDVVVPEWPSMVRIRSLSLADRFKVESLASANPTPETSTTFHATLVQLSCCNGDGNLLFAPEDIPALTTKNQMALERIFWAAIRLNKMRAEDVEELKRNFTSAP